MNKHARFDCDDSEPLHSICEYEDGSLVFALDSLPEEIRELLPSATCPKELLQISHIWGTYEPGQKHRGSGCS